MRYTFIMTIPMFVDLQGFVVDKNFVVKEFAALREGYVLSHCIFESPVPWYILTKAERQQASWLIAIHHGFQWEDGIIPYSMAK